MIRPIVLTALVASTTGMGFAVPGQAPLFSVGSGRYGSAQSVVMTAGAGATIRYTSDGSTPEATSTLYTEAVAVTASHPLRARAFYTSFDPSPVTTASYIIGSTSTLPIMDLVLPPFYLYDNATGISTNWWEHGDEWERPCFVVLMSPDGTDVREAPCGIRVHGGTSRDEPKKAWRLYFRSEYGPNDWNLGPYWTHSPDATVDQLVLRSAANDCWLVDSTGQRDRATYLRDQLFRDWHAAMGYRAGDGFYVALHINGQYWGLYNPMERINDEFCQDTFGGSDWDVIKGTWDSTVKYHNEAVDGDMVAWNELLAWNDAHDLSIPANYAELQQRIDVDNFLDWFVLNIFGQNRDWPQNNFIMARRRGDPGALWRFFENDAEWGIGLYDTGYQNDTLAWAIDPTFYRGSTHNPNQGSAPLARIFANIVGGDIYIAVGGVNQPLHRNGSSEGRNRFIRLMQDALNFELSPAVTRASLTAAGSHVQPELSSEANRWASSTARTPAQLLASWTSAYSAMDTFLANRQAFVRGLMVTRFGLAGTQTVNVNRAGVGTGRVSVNGHIITPPWTGVFFAGQPVELVPVADLDSHFASWSGVVTGTGAAQTFFAGSSGSVTATATFGQGPAANNASGVIINEYWVNDGGTAYPTIGDRAIHGDWIELLVTDPAGADIRGWRVTNNLTIDELSPANLDNGSIIFPASPELSDIPQHTCILLVTSNNATNDATFPADDLDPSDGQMVLYAGNRGFDEDTDPGFGVSENPATSLVLLAPGATSIFADDVGVDFIGENGGQTPAFFGVALTWTNPFVGIGDDDGAVFTRDASNGFNNDDGIDPTKDDLPGTGGWIVDPPRQFTGDDVSATQILTPGALNPDQQPPFSGISLH